MDKFSINDTTIFNSIDASRMAEKKDLANKGRIQGEKNLPPSTAKIPDETEADIIQETSSIRSNTVQSIQLSLQSLNKLISKERANIGTRVLDTDITPIVTKLEQRANLDLIAISDTETKLKEQQIYFKEWRARRNLKRPAEESKSALSFFADLFLLAIAEGGLNLFFFMENNELGMLGAFVEAFLIAGANILVCVVFGFVLLKRMNSVFILNKLLGFFSALVLLLSLPIIHTIIGFYRIARQSLPNSADEIASHTEIWTAIQWAVHGEFDRLDEMSIIMCAIGVILGAYAARKGYEFGDRYPDYTKNYWSFEDRRLDYIDHLDEIHGDMLEFQSAASSGIRIFFSNLQNSLSSLENYQSRKTELKISLKNYEQHLTDTTRKLLAEYRGANISSRTTPPPETFNIEFNFDNPLFDGDQLCMPELAEQLDKNKEHESEARIAADIARHAAQELQNRITIAIEAANRVVNAGRNLREEHTS